MNTGNVTIVDRPPPRTLGELAQQEVDRAQTKVNIAQVELRGALERQRLIRQYGKEDQPLTPSPS